MSRARYLNKDPRQTAAASEHGSGCFSIYFLTPVAAVFIVAILAFFALRAPMPTAALRMDAPITNTMPTAPLSAVVETSQDSPTSLFEISGSSSPVLSPIFTKQIQHWGSDIVRWASASALDPNLVAVVMQIESCGDPRAISRSGAIGLFQVMPFHFHITDNPFDPDTNALRGLDYLSRSLQKAGGNPRLALAGYNGGIGVISRGEWTWAAETNRYVYYGAPIYEDARSGADSSSALEEWYGKYGAGLCRQASNRLGLSE